MGGSAASISCLVLNDGAGFESARSLARALQSVGMISAIIYIFCTEIRVHLRAVSWGIAGFLAGAPLGWHWLSGFGATAAGLVVHAAIWAGFGTALMFNRTKIVHDRAGQTPEVQAGAWELAAGFAGGVAMSPLAGGCAAIPFYLVLVFGRRIDIRSAMASSLFIMLLSSLFGLRAGPNHGTLESGAFRTWVLVAPMACVGVPLGFRIAARAPVIPALAIIAISCLANGVWVINRVGNSLGSVDLLFAFTALVSPLLLTCVLQAFIRNTSRCESLNR